MAKHNGTPGDAGKPSGSRGNASERLIDTEYNKAPLFTRNTSVVPAPWRECYLHAGASSRRGGPGSD